VVELRGIRHRYAGRLVLDLAQFAVPDGALIAVVGHNGAGKSTLLRLLALLETPTEGQVLLDGKPVPRRPPAALRRRVTMVEQRPILFRGTVRENLDVARTGRRGRWTRERVYELFPRLRERDRNAGNKLSGGEQQMLAIAMALLSRPRLLVLDEPSLGLAPLVVDQLYQAVAGLKRDGLTILLVEQQVFLALELADRAYVLETGRIRQEGPGRALLADAHVRDAYLGAAGAG